MKRLLLSLLEALFLTSVISGFAVVFAVMGPQIYRKALRNYVADRTFILYDPEGGHGTGFQIKAKSGKVFMVTNKHVCVSVKANGFLYAKRNEADGMESKPLKIVGKSNITDLCILEPFDGNFLELGKVPQVGEVYHAMGFPTVSKKVMTSGEYLGFIANYVSTSGPLGEKVSKNDCNGLDEFIGKDAKTKKETCDSRNNAYQTSIRINHGSSGGPMFDYKGDVVGVIYSMEVETFDGRAITKTSLTNFLNDY